MGLLFLRLHPYGAYINTDWPKQNIYETRSSNPSVKPNPYHFHGSWYLEPPIPSRCLSYISRISSSISSTRRTSSLLLGTRILQTRSPFFKQLVDLNRLAPTPLHMMETLTLSPNFPRSLDICKVSKLTPGSSLMLPVRTPKSQICCHLAVQAFLFEAQYLLLFSSWSFRWIDCSIRLDSRSLRFRKYQGRNLWWTRRAYSRNDLYGLGWISRRIEWGVCISS